MNQLCLPGDELPGWTVPPLMPQQCTGSKEPCQGLQSMAGGHGRAVVEKADLALG